MQEDFICVRVIAMFMCVIYAVVEIYVNGVHNEIPRLDVLITSLHNNSSGF